MRGKKAKKRKGNPDSKYNSLLVTKLINKIMKHGKKEIAEQIVYGMMDTLGKEMEGKPLQILEKAIDNVKPRIEIRPRRVGGVNYQVPTPVSDKRQLSLALRWIILGARDRRKKTTFREALSQELIDAYNETGYAIKKKEDAHKMAEANKAFAHFQW